MESEGMLRTVPDRGWFNGLDNLFHNEFSRWWGRGVWWKHLLRWTLLVNAFYAVVCLGVGQQPQDGVPASEVKVMMFFILSAMSTGIGMIVAHQGSIIGERQLGTAAWIMSKPVSRAAFVVSKFTGGAAGFLSIILVQAVLGYGSIAFWTGRILPLMAFAAGVGLWLLGLLFYLSMVLMLGTMLGSRGGVTGIAIAIMLVGQNMKGLAVLQRFGPFRLMDAASSLVLGQPLDHGFPSAVLTTVLATTVMVALAAWRFEGEDL